MPLETMTPPSAYPISSYILLRRFPTNSDIVLLLLSNTHPLVHKTFTLSSLSIYFSYQASSTAPQFELSFLLSSHYNYSSLFSLSWTQIFTNRP